MPFFQGKIRVLVLKNVGPERRLRRDGPQNARHQQQSSPCRVCACTRKHKSENRRLQCKNSRSSRCPEYPGDLVSRSSATSVWPLCKCDSALVYRQNTYFASGHVVLVRHLLLHTRLSHFTRTVLVIICTPYVSQTLVN